MLNFENSRTGDLTCSFQGRYLHSKYNPQNEGEKFAQNIEADFSPSCLFILEPALSYSAPFLKKKFPEAEICAIRFTEAFSKSDSLWDKVFYLHKNQIPLSEQLFNTFGEEKLCASLTFDWAPSKQVFAEDNMEAWKEIKTAIIKARNVITTRAYFSKRWLKNALIFAQNVTHTYKIKKGKAPILLTASGPSLESSIPFIKAFRDSFFLLAVSSSLMPLVKNNIMPDLVISSDGGYWAKKHIDLPNLDKEIPFALECESAVPKKILHEKKIIPLAYEDGIGKGLLDKTGCPYTLSQRNGTVAGTALELALNLTSGNIYICGLDQAPSPAFQHTQPNALENDNAKKDFRLRNKETRVTKSRFNSENALEIYRNWFITNSDYFSKRVFRLSDNFSYSFSLGKISEVNWQYFENREKTSDIEKTAIIKADFKINQQERLEKIQGKLESMSKTEEFKNEVFPMDTILLKRELAEDKKIMLKEAIEKKITELLSSLRTGMENQAEIK